MRTSLQHEIGGYDPLLPHSGDLEMWLRAAAIATSDASMARRKRTIASTRTVCSGPCTRAISSI